MIDKWPRNMNSGKMTGFATVDLMKAFDTVNHEILLNKLYEIGATDITVKWFCSYLTKRTQKVSFKGSLSNALPVNTGVPQGSILGPLLFIIFINNMCNVIKYCDISMYVEDTTLSVCGNNASDISRKLKLDLEALVIWLRNNKLRCGNNAGDISRKLKLDLEALVIWLCNNKLFLNTNKTKIMLAGAGAKLNHVQCDNFSVKIDDCELEKVN